MAASLPFLNVPAAAGQAPARLLPLNTPKIDHLDVIVPNVEASARFYMGVFNTTLHAQPFQGGFRYFVLFGDLPANRQVGYLAIGDSRGRGTYIGHFCTSVFDYRRDSAAIIGGARGRRGEGGSRQAVGRRRGRRHLLRPRRHRDPVPARARHAGDRGRALAARGAPQGPGDARGVDHVLLHVPIWRKASSSTGSSTARKRAATKLPNVSGFRSATRGSAWSRPRPARSRTSRTSASRWRPSTAPRSARGWRSWARKIVPSPDEAGALRFTDLDGIAVELNA